MNIEDLMKNQFNSKNIFISGCRNLTEICMMILDPMTNEIEEFFKPFNNIILSESNKETDVYYLSCINKIFEELNNKVTQNDIIELQNKSNVLIKLNNININLTTNLNYINGFYNSITNTIELYIPMNIIYNYNFVEKPNLKYIKNTLVHELTHCLDIDTIKKIGHIIPPPADTRKKEVYYNNSLEFHAFGLQLIEALEELLDNNEILEYEFNKLDDNDLKGNKIIIIKILNNMLKDPKYYKILGRFSTFINYLTYNNKKKLYRRIHEYFLEKELNEWHY